MDKTAQIKKNLISRIKESKNLIFLNALQAIFDASEQSLYQLSPEQQTLIETSKNDIHAANFVRMTK